MNRLTVAIALFVLLFILVNVMKPVLLYNPDGSLRPFGIGYRKRTVVPLWLVVILLAILTFSISLYVTP
uniref:Uncharacterized protein n=1 Tax=viral metagenome TaxID=1070528 RepID=A0A6C0AGF8_9ZZZZ